MKLSTKQMLPIFVVLYTLIPSYCQIGGTQATNLLALILVALYIFIYRKHLKTIKLTQESLVIGIWVIARLTSMFVTGSFFRVVMFFISFVGIGYIFINYISEKEKFIHVLDAVIYAGAIASVLGIIEAITGFNVFSLLNNSGAVLNYNNLRLGMMRIISYTGQTISYCMYCSIVACLAMYRIANLKNKTNEKRKFLVIYWLLCINILFTFSRSIIICFVISQIIILWYLGKKKFLKVILRVAIVMSVIIVASKLFFPSFADTMSQYFYMMLAVFNGNYADKLMVGWGTEDVSGIGERLLLYRWVWESVQGNLLFGKGEYADFSYSYRATDGIYFFTKIKRSIEVHHLYILYHFGFITLVPEVCMFLSFIIQGLRKAFRKNPLFESKMGFNFVFFVIIFMDMLSWFTVNMGSEKNTLYFTIFLWLSYNINKIYLEKTNIGIMLEEKS